MRPWTDGEMFNGCWAFVESGCVENNTSTYSLTRRRHPFLQPLYAERGATSSGVTARAVSTRSGLSVVQRRMGFGWDEYWIGRNVGQKLSDVCGVGVYYGISRTSESAAMSPRIPCPLCSLEEPASGAKMPKEAGSLSIPRSSLATIPPTCWARCLGLVLSPKHPAKRHMSGLGEDGR